MPHFVPWVQAIVDAFEARHPNVTVDLVNGWEDKVVSMVAGGVPPDVVSYDSPAPPSWANQGFLSDLSPFAKKDRSFAETDFHPTLLWIPTWKGTLYGLPINSGGPLGLFYNADTFEAHGLATPTPEWTWEELKSAAKRLALDTNGDGYLDKFGFADVWDHDNYWPAWVWGAGGQFWNRDYTRSLFDSEAALRGFRFQFDLYFSDHVAPRIIDYALAEPGVSTEVTHRGAHLELFERGDIAMMFGNWYNQPDEEFFGFGAVPLPFGPSGRRNATISVTFLGIHPATKNPDLAWQFLRFAAWAEGWATTNVAGGNWGVPAMSSVARSLLSRREGNWLTWWEVGMPSAERTPTFHPGIGSIAGLMRDAYNKAARGEQSIEASVSEAVRQINAQIAETDRTW